MLPSAYTTTLCITNGADLGPMNSVTSCGVDREITPCAHVLQSFTPGTQRPVGEPTLV